MAKNRNSRAARRERRNNKMILAQHRGQAAVIEQVDGVGRVQVRSLERIEIVRPLESVHHVRSQMGGIMAKVLLIPPFLEAVDADYLMRECQPRFSDNEDKRFVF